MKKNLISSVETVNNKKDSLPYLLAGVGDIFFDDFCNLQDKEKTLSICKNWLESSKDIIKDEFLKTGKTAGLFAGHTKLIDTLISVIFQKMVKSDKLPELSIVAVGGYGRGEMFPYSDIDILFIYSNEDKSQASRIAETLLYMLWDLGLKVGQAHRTIDETLEMAKNDMVIRTNLLDARYVAGDRNLFENFQTRFENEVIQGKIAEFIEAKLSERDARHQRFGDSRYMLEPNVKEGKGGLRDAHTLWWLAKAAYSLKNNKELISHDLVSRDEYKEFEKSSIFLCKVRTHLHYIAGRAEDRLTFDYQHRLAVAMGFTNPSANQAIERFMRRYFAAVRNIGNTTRIFCALLEESNKRKPRLSFARFWNPLSGSSFRIDGERLNVRSESVFEKSPVTIIEIFRFAQIHDLHIHPRALKLIANNLHLIDHNLQNDRQANEIFLDIILSEKGAETTLRRMSDAGVLGRFIRDFGRVIGQTQFNMYHVYTVDEHTLVAIGILHAIESGRMKKELPLASELIFRIKLRRVLYVALFCHDIAKGRGGDHSILGERVGIRLAKRLDFSPDEIKTVGWLVRYHLLFSATATKRDLNDPKTIQDFVSIVQSPERLKLLLVLTVADICAVSTAAWNAWKGVLLRELYSRAEQCMGAGKVEFIKFQTDHLYDDLHEILSGWDKKEIEHYLDLGNYSFWTGIEPSQHAVIAKMVAEADLKEHPVVINISHNNDRSATEVIICTGDRSGLFSMMAGAVSLAGANIINAKIFTLKNGIAVEIFQLQDLSGGIFADAEKLKKMSVYINQVLKGELDLSSVFAERRIAYTKTRGKSLDILEQVIVDNEASNVHSIIEFTGRDRVGLLYEVTNALADMGISIVTAHISTYGMQVVDVFYVKDNFGMKILHNNKIRQIREKLFMVISHSD